MNIKFTDSKALNLILFVKLLERFSWNGCRSFIVFYFENDRFLFTAAKAQQVNAHYSALAYLLPLIVGLWAVTAKRRTWSVVAGAALLSAGFFELAFSSSLVVSLGLLVVGSGFFTANLRALVGDIYAPNDKRHDRAFADMYVFSNLGTFLGILACVLAISLQGYRLALILCGLSMLVSLALAILASLLLAARRTPVKADLIAGNSASEANELVSEQIGTHYSDRYKVIAVVTAFAALFWLGFEQKTGSLNFFAKLNMRQNFFGFTFLAPWLLLVNPLLIVLLSPAFSKLWKFLSDRDREPSPFAKQGIGLVFLGLGFLLIPLSASVVILPPSIVPPISPLWLVGLYTLHSMGELCLEPIGQALVSKLAPRQRSAFMLAFYDASSFAAIFFSGDLQPILGGAMWITLAIVPIIAGIGLILSSRKLNDLSHSEELEGGRL